jgi:hypothetical protein
VRRDRICDGAPATYATNGFAYDAYGNIIRHTNEVGVVTETTYDTYFYTLPASHITGNFVTSVTYDRASGQVTDQVSPAGLVTKHIYDEFFRLKETWISSVPNGTPDVWKIRYDYNRGGIVNGVSQNYVKVTKNNALADDPGHETWTYTDGLGRTIQTRVESEAQQGLAAPFRVSDLVYGQRGETVYQTSPYLDEGFAFTAPDGFKLSAFSEYDPIGRVFRTTPSVNVTFQNGLPSGSPVILSGEADSPLAPQTIA